MQGIRLNVLDLVTVTREGARQVKGYQDGRIVTFAANLTNQGFARGERGKVIGFDGDKVELQMGEHVWPQGECMLGHKKFPISGNYALRDPPNLGLVMEATETIIDELEKLCPGAFTADLPQSSKRKTAPNEA